MKLTDYTDLINKIVSKPEEAPTLAKDLISNIKSDVEQFDAAQTRLNEQDKKIKDLQDTNIKLFLAQTSPKPETNNEGEEDHVTTLDDLVNTMKGAFDELK